MAENIYNLIRLRVKDAYPNSTAQPGGFLFHLHLRFLPRSRLSPTEIDESTGLMALPAAYPQLTPRNVQQAWGPYLDSIVNRCL